jgi:hypothetical protein
MLAASLACGLTRVGSLQFRPGENDGGQEGIYTWLGHTMEHHLTTHDSSAPAQAMITEIYRWYAERFAYLLTQLDRYPEADGGSLLDHTLVLWGSEIGEGATHSIDNVPFVIAGGGRGGVNGGQYLRVSSAMVQRLLVTLCHYMGMSDIQTYGTIDHGSGPLAGILS